MKEVMKMSEYRLKTPKVIEKRVLGAYQSVEDTVVGVYKSIEDKFVDTFLEKVEDGDKASQTVGQEEER